MDDLMARTMVENLSIGINPVTGEMLSTTDSCANDVIQEALKTVLEFCTIDSYATILKRQRNEKIAKKKMRVLKREERYPNAGSAWTPNEERKLKSLYSSGYAIAHISNILKRTPSAVKSHLEKMSLY